MKFTLQEGQKRNIVQRFSPLAAISKFLCFFISFYHYCVKPQIQSGELKSYLDLVCGQQAIINICQIKSVNIHFERFQIQFQINKALKRPLKSARIA